ncbi:hypothetical protein ACGVWS_11305 [Enterobacteriaceae bacterium LUAb1]
MYKTAAIPTSFTGEQLTNKNRCMPFSIAFSIIGLASIIGILMIYAHICTTLVSSAFSLQVYLPDYVIAWLGGREAAQMMKGAVESARNMFAGFGGKNSILSTPRYLRQT